MLLGVILAEYALFTLKNLTNSDRQLDSRNQRCIITSSFPPHSLCLSQSHDISLSSGLKQAD